MLQIFALVVTVLGHLHAGSDAPSKVEVHWGSPVQGVQMSIRLPTNAVASGSETNLILNIKNGAKSFIYVADLNPATDTILCLTNLSGKEFRITPEFRLTPGRPASAYSNVDPFIRRIETNETYECSVPLKISKDIPPGTYQLRAIRYFRIGEGNAGQKVESSSVALKIE